MRHASDLSQEKSFIAAPEAGKHKEPTFGTHHAYDAWRLFHTRGLDLNQFSSAIKLNTQYMHSIWFHLKVKRPVTLDEVIGKLEAKVTPRRALPAARLDRAVARGGLQLRP